MSWIQCKFCTNKYPPQQMFEGKCPECQADHLRAIALDEANRPKRIAAQPKTTSQPEQPAMTNEEAVLAAAQQLKETEGATLTDVLTRARKIKGRGISSGYLSPSGPGYHLRPQIEEALGLTKPERVPSVVEALKAENERLRAELEAAQTTPAQSIEAALRAELERDKATLSRICGEMIELQRQLQELSEERTTMASQVALLGDLVSRYTGEPSPERQRLRVVGGEVA